MGAVVASSHEVGVDGTSEPLIAVSNQERSSMRSPAKRPASNQGCISNRDRGESRVERRSERTAYKGSLNNVIEIGIAASCYQPMPEIQLCFEFRALRTKRT